MPHRSQLQYAVVLNNEHSGYKIKLLCRSMVVTILGFHFMHIIHVGGYWCELFYLEVEIICAF